MSAEQLDRQLSRPVLLCYGVGTIIGAGVYVLIGEVAREAGNLALWSFLLAAGLAGITAVTYSTLAPVFPEAAGEAAYLNEAFGKKWLTTSVGLLLAVTGVFSAGVLARGFDGYFSQFVAAPEWLVTSSLILILGGLAGAGVRLAASAVVVITAIEVAGLLFILLLSHRVWTDLPTLLSDMVDPQHGPGWAGVGAGTVLAFYAFIGFEDIVNMAEESKNPRHDLPIAVYGALLIATGLYLAVGTVALLSLESGTLAESVAPLAAVVGAHGGPSWIVSLISLVAVLNGMIVQMIMASRVLFGLARRGALPDWIGRISPNTKAPRHATLVVTVGTLLVTLALPLGQLAEATSCGLLIVFACVHAAALKLRKSHPEVRLSVVWPALGLLCCGGLLAAQIWTFAKG